MTHFYSKNPGGFHETYDAEASVANSGGKPPYRIPTMEEVRALPWNGLTAVDCFSGGGGTCTGLRMAGFKVAWANEFVPVAQQSYEANKAPDCHLDKRDIRDVRPEDILERLGIRKGELDLFTGSPPCQAFSTAGKRHKGWGKDKTYEHGAKQKNEDLFQEYVRLLRGLMPKAFIAENVSGLVKGVAKGYFIEIMRALKASGYRVECRVLDAQWLGVPQARQRTIFVGVREDLCAAHGVRPEYPSPLPWRYSVREAYPWIGRCVHDTSGKMGAGVNSYSAGVVTDRPCPAVTCASPGNDLAVPHVAGPETDISRYAIGAEWDKLQPGGKSDKYQNLVKAHPDQPSPTVCASHGTGSIASVVHPTEKRKFTIAELRRIGSFPDDYVLCGSYADQWARIGNSVPPVMAWAYARVVRDRVLLRAAGLPPYEHDPPCLGPQFHK